jgi:hypothetical protein
MADEIENPMSMTEVRHEIKERGEAFREQFNGDLCEGHQPPVSSYIEETTAPFVSGFVKQMKEFGIETPEQAAAMAQANPLIREHAQFASATLNAITQDAVARRGAQYDGAFRELCPTAYDRHGNIRAEARADAVAYLEAQGWSDEQIANEYEWGELRHPVESAKLYAKSRQWKSDQRELKKLDAKYHNGSMSVREAARRRTLKGA